MDRRPHKSETPEERATRLAGVMVEALENDPDHDDEIRAIAFVYPNIGRGGICLHGDAYTGDVKRAVNDALQSLDALLQTIGESLTSFEVPQTGGQG